MDNEAPKYASWVPEAGGYVANGKVVSKSPIYDAQRKLRLDVDASQFPNTQPQQSPNVQTANNPMTNNGITTANTTGSGTDVNSLATNIGSMGSTNNNTATTGGVLTSPAMTSPNTNLKPSQISGKTMDDLLADFAYFQSENNLQGMINTLTQMSVADGQDRSAQISELQSAREQKIMSIDDQYLANYDQARSAYSQAQRDYNQAVAVGDAEAAKQAQAEAEQAQLVMDQIQAQQDEWRNSVGYQDAMTSAYNRELEENHIDYVTTYMNGIRDKIVPAILQLTDEYMNFQYDPFADTSLQIAQQYATSRVKEQMNSTGMYYSSMTQNAVAKAVAELVPVYEKMAREEKLQQIQVLQSTASFLLNLEEAQFDMWRAQIQLQFEANEEKRRQWAQAVESSNARGYVTNEEAAILGVEPGSLSQQAREHEQELQEQLDAEARALQQKKVLENYRVAMALQEYEGKLRIDQKFGIGDFAPRSGGGDGTYEVEYGADGNVISYKYKGSNPPSKIGGNTEGEEVIIDSKTQSILNRLKGEDGTYDEAKIEDFFNTGIDGLEGTEKAKAIDALYYDYVEKEIDAYTSKMGANPFATTGALEKAEGAIDKFDGWLDKAGTSEEYKNIYKQRGGTYLRDKVAGVENFDRVPTGADEFFALNSSTARGNAVSSIESKYGVQKAPTGTTANYAPVITGDKTYVPESQIQRTMVSGRVNYIIKDENTKSVENYIPVNKEKSTGLYYYMTENTSDGKLRKVYVDKNKVKSTQLKKLQGIVLDDNGNATLSKDYDDPARVRFVAKDDKTGQYYYVKY